MLYPIQKVVWASWSGLVEGNVVKGSDGVGVVAVPMVREFFEVPNCILCFILGRYLAIVDGPDVHYTYHRRTYAPTRHCYRIRLLAEMTLSLSSSVRLV